jgi:ABC-type sugar transport system substrate-binding protein
MFVEWWPKHRPGEKAYILSLDFPSLEFAQRRNVAFLAYVKQVLGDLVEVVAEQETKGQAEAGQKVTETMLIAHPEINFIFGVNDTTIVGAMAAVENAGRRDIAYAGIGGEPAALKALQKPLYREGGGWAFDVGGKMNPVSWGYAMVEAAHKLGKGEKVGELDFSWTYPVWRENVREYGRDLNEWRKRAGLKPLDF